MLDDAVVAGCWLVGDEELVDEPGPPFEPVVEVVTPVPAEAEVAPFVAPVVEDEDVGCDASNAPGAVVEPLPAESVGSTSPIDSAVVPAAEPTSGETAAVPVGCEESASTALAVGIGSLNSSSTIDTPAHATDTAAALPASHSNPNPTDLIMLTLCGSDPHDVAKATLNGS